MIKKLLNFLILGFSILFSQQIFAQELKGIVTSSDKNEVLPGVSVMIKGTTIGTTTDVNGAFTIKVSNPKATLVLSSVGFSKKEIPLNGQTKLTISLQPDEMSLG